MRGRPIQDIGHSRQQDSRLPSRRNVGRPASRPKEPQRFSALQQPLLAATLHFIWSHIQTEPRGLDGLKSGVNGSVVQRLPQNEMTRTFYETNFYNKSGGDADAVMRMGQTLQDSSPSQVCKFLLDILHQGIFSVAELVISIMYLSTFKKKTGVLFHQYTWRPLLVTCLLLADKMWEDKPMRLTDMARLFPVLHNSELKKLEHYLVAHLEFDVVVTPDEFMAFCENLLKEQVHPDIKRTIDSSEYGASLRKQTERTHHDQLPLNAESKVVHEQAWQSVWTG